VLPHSEPTAKARRLKAPQLADIAAMECRIALAQNHLIELLPKVDRRRLLAACEPTHFLLAQSLAEPQAVTRHVYFPVCGFASLVTLLDGKPILEVGMVGREGLLGIHVALGVKTAPLHALVQGAGSAWRISTPAFLRILGSSPSLQRIVDRYMFVLIAQFAASAACIRFHEIHQRLARWLLMTRDRAHADKFRVTHAFLAYMLGVRRVGITTAAGELQRRGLIEYRRGDVTVLDASGLERSACSCYSADRRCYDQLLAVR
jgi:CRP-like cAMP-binding protein